MKRIVSGAVCVGAATALNMAAFAQSTTVQSLAGSTAAAQQTAGDQQVTVSGCVQRETDYRRARDAGRGGVAGTGLGAANEFVLVDASMSSASTGAAGTAGATTGTTGTATGTAYELTGANERQVAPHAGRRVEISGTLKAAEVTPSGRPTGGVTAGKPPEGIEVAGQDLQLRELEVSSVRQISGACPAQ